MVADLGSTLGATWQWGPDEEDVGIEDLDCGGDQRGSAFARGVSLGSRIGIRLSLASIHCSSCMPTSYLMAAVSAYRFLQITEVVRLCKFLGESLAGSLTMPTIMVSWCIVFNLEDVALMTST